MNRLVDFAKAHRYRLRNLHDGRPVPPAKLKRCGGKLPPRSGYVGADERLDAIVGTRGYLIDEGDRLGIFYSSPTNYGCNKVRTIIVSIGGQVTQDGDCELAGSIPWRSIDDALKLIRVSKLAPGNPNLRKVLSAQIGSGA